MPMYNFKCTKCSYKFEDLVNSEVKEIPCEKCEEKAERQLSFPNISIPAHHQSSPKKGAGEVPIGEFKGDDDYKWMKENPERGWGETP